MLRAIALGLLTFVVTGVIALVIAIPYFLLGTAAAGLDPITIIAGVFGLRELGGFFAAQFILLLLIALLGDFGTAIVSWFVNRSGKLAAVTFASALGFQVIAVAVVLPATMKMSQAIMEAGSEHESSFERYATIGEVTFELQEPFTDSRGIDSRLVEVSLFKKLILVVPISVARAGPYDVLVRYPDHSEFGETLVKDVRQTLSAGSNIVRIEFLPHQSRQYGYPSPKSVVQETRGEDGPTGIELVQDVADSQMGHDGTLRVQHDQGPERALASVARQRPVRAISARASHPE